MKKLLPIAFAIMCFCSQGVVFAETDTEQGQYLSDTKAAIAVQKQLTTPEKITSISMQRAEEQPSQESNQKQTISNIRWSIVIQCQGKPGDTSKNDN